MNEFLKPKALSDDEIALCGEAVGDFEEAEERKNENGKN